MATSPSRLRSPRFQRRALWAGGAVLLAGAVVLASVLIGGRGEARPVDRQGAAVTDVSKVPKSQKLAPAARLAAQRFILTAVARKDLREAYALAGPQIRQGMSLEEWLTGNIAVVPFPVAGLDLASMKVDYAYATEAAIEVALLPKSGKGQIFYMDLIKRDGRWLVDSWVPRSAPMVPMAPG